jgi:NADP-dependent alcohol dehydrogenase
LKLKRKIGTIRKTYFQFGTEDRNRKEAINKTVAFFHTMGMDTKLSDYTKDFDKTANFIVNRFEERGWLVGRKNKISL